MAPPPLFFQLGFYVGALSFAVAFGATLMAGGPPDTGILRGVQALMAFVVLGWLAELVANTAPPPRRAAQQPQAGPLSAPAPVAHRAPIQERDRTPLPPYIASADDGDEDTSRHQRTQGAERLRVARRHAGAGRGRRSARGRRRALQRHRTRSRVGKE